VFDDLHLWSAFVVPVLICFVFVHAVKSFIF
jgi:hypothetical protein